MSGNPYLVASSGMTLISDRQTWLKALERVESLAAGHRLARLVAHPGRYLFALLYREIFYRLFRRPIATKATAFFGLRMHILLPASTDIYLTGGKSHSSEIRLARLFIRKLQPGDIVLDVGAHYGYFALLAARLVGPAGQVFAFEASPSTFEVLRRNQPLVSALEVRHAVVADHAGASTFYEFPNRYCEFNALDVSQFAGEPWFARNTPVARKVPTVRLDDVMATSGNVPALIKMDVEGGEWGVIRGMEHLLKKERPWLVMEYLSPHRGNTPHREAEALLERLGYRPHAIDPEGHPVPVGSVSDWLLQQGVDSDNMVFIRS